MDSVFITRMTFIRSFLFSMLSQVKGGAFVRTKLKSLNSSRVIDHTFNAGAKIDVVRIERRPHQFLYTDEMGYHFMNSQTYEQTTLTPKQTEDTDLLKEGQEDIELLFHADEEKVLSCKLPKSVTLKVQHTEPGLRGDTATNALKPAQLRNRRLDTGPALYRRRYAH